MKNLKNGKLCSGCKIHKSFAGFGKKGIFKDGLDNRCLECAAKYRMDCYYANPTSGMLSQAKYRAKKKGMDFNITKEDILIPHTCPVLDIPIFTKGNKDNSPSIDRIDNSKGYIKDNIQVISYRANRLKSDSTVEELRRLLNHMESL